MTIITAPHEWDEDDLYVDLSPVLGRALFLKCQGFNFAGSIKLRPACEMVEAAERAGQLGPGSVVVESSSGNLGVALAMICASKGYGFVCVTDSRCNLAARRMMEALGARVHCIAEPHPETGFLGARLDYVAALCRDDVRHVWLNQYRNPANWGSHYRLTAPAIARQFPEVDVVFIGAGTCGTLMGCARWFREWHRPVQVVAVDSVGSISFGGPPSQRMIPGLGSGVVPPALDQSFVDDLVLVEESATVRACHRLARHGFVMGGSTGTVVSGAQQWLAANDPGGVRTAVAISPDLGERYLDTVYYDNWVRDLFGDDALDEMVLAD